MSTFVLNEYFTGDCYEVSLHRYELLGAKSRKRNSMVATGQEIVKEKKNRQGQGKVREFHFESGKIYVFEKSQGKVKF